MQPSQGAGPPGGGGGSIEQDDLCPLRQDCRDVRSERRRAIDGDGVGVHQVVTGGKDIGLETRGRAERQRAAHGERTDGAERFGGSRREDAVDRDITR